MALYKEFEKQGNWLFKHRGQLPLVLIVAGLIVYTYDLNVNVKEASYNTALEVAAFIISMLGLAVRIYAIGYSAQGTSGRNTEKQVAEEVNTLGAYSLVRHPLYVGNFLMWLGICLFIGNLWFIICFILIYWIYYERIMYTEEQFLIKKFGDKYLDWASRIPAFIPDFHNWKKPSTPFNYKEILKREYNGLISLAIVFMAFDYIGDYMRIGGLFLDNDDKIWAAFFVVSLLILLVCKYLKKRTRVLDA